MARAISKHSRAARRAQRIDEIRELADLPRAEKTDVVSSVIRTASKNEDLLNRKMDKSKRRNKKVGKSINKPFGRLGDKLKAKELGALEKSRIQKTLNLTNVLDGKIAKSIARAKYVQAARKAGWDATNSRIKEELDLVHQNFQSAKKEEDGEADADKMETEEEHVVTFGDLEEEENEKKNRKFNAFAALEDEVEA